MENTLKRIKGSHGAIAEFWTKDGLWHIARPAISPTDTSKTGATGARFWTDEAYETREDAKRAIG